MGTLSLQGHLYPHEVHPALLQLFLSLLNGLKRLPFFLRQANDQLALEGREVGVVSRGDGGGTAAKVRPIFKHDAVGVSSLYGLVQDGVAILVLFLELERRHPRWNAFRGSRNPQSAQKDYI